MVQKSIFLTNRCRSRSRYRFQRCFSVTTYRSRSRSQSKCNQKVISKQECRETEENSVKIIPEIDPSHQSVGNWIDKVEKLRIDNDWSDNTTLFLAISQLQGDARTWHKSVFSKIKNDDDIPSWAQWKEKLIVAFRKTPSHFTETRESENALENPADGTVTEKRKSRESVKFEQEESKKDNRTKDNGKSSHTSQESNQQFSTKLVSLGDKRIQLNIGFEPRKLNDARHHRVQVNGQQLRALIDLASDWVTIQRSAANKLNLPIRPVSQDVELVGYDGSIVKPCGICEIVLQVDLVRRTTIEACVVPNEIQGSPIVVGSVYLDRPGVTVLQRDGKVRVLDSACLEIRESKPEEDEEKVNNEVMK